MAAEPIHVTDADFEATVIKSELPVIVDFWAPWCGPCRMVAPILDKLAKEYDGKMVVAKVNVDNSPMVAGQFGIRSIPTLLYVKGGKIVDQVIGNVPKSDLEARLKNLL